jgi:vancomycin permeability regulator SanA
VRWAATRAAAAGRNGASSSPTSAQAPRLTVVTQRYHLARAVTICRKVGIDAVGAGTDAHEATSAGYQARTRELLANVKATVDVALRPAPRFLGPHEPGVERALATPR